MQDPSFRRLVLGVCAGSNYGLAPITMLPVIAGALIERMGLDESTVGLLASVELGGIAFASLLLASVVSRLPLRAVGLAGGALSCLCNGLSMLASSADELIWLRGATGLGAGAAVAVANAGAATNPNPDRIFAIVTVLISGFGALWLTVTPQVIGVWGHAGGYGVVTVGTLVGLPFMLMLPRRSAPESSAVTFSFPHPVLGVLALAALFLGNVGDIPIWLFSERIANRLGIAPADIGMLLGMTTLFSLVGPGLAALIHTRWGRILPLTVGLSLAALCAVVLPRVGGQFTFALCVLGFSTSWLFSLPYLFGAAAALDEKGSWAAAAGSVGPLGAALGPGIAGLVAVRWSYEGVGLFTAGAMLLAVIAMLATQLYRSGPGSNSGSVSGGSP